MALSTHGRMFLAAVAVAGAVMAPSAQADEMISSGVWDQGGGSGTCTTGQNTRTCTYKVTFTNCTEAGASTGTGPRVIVPCTFTFSGKVTVQPRLNAAGRVVGCTSVVGTTTQASATFDSSVSGSFDRTAVNPIPIREITVQSAAPDQSNAVVKFVGEATDGLMVWAVRGSLTGTTCAPSKSAAATVVEGSVVIAGRTTIQ